MQKVHLAALACGFTIQRVFDRRVYILRPGGDTEYWNPLENMAQCNEVQATLCMDITFTDEYVIAVLYRPSKGKYARVKRPLGASVQSRQKALANAVVTLAARYDAECKLSIKGFRS